MTTSDPAVLADLLARVEAASGPSFALEQDIHRALAPRAVLDAFADGTPVPADWGLPLAPPAYTASLDVALRLVERLLPGCETLVLYNPRHCDGRGCAYATVETEDGANGSVALHGSTRPLALLAAFLRALLSKASGAGQ